MSPMRNVIDWTWWLIGTPAWTWIVIGLMVLLGLLILTLWCMLILGKHSDEESRRIFKQKFEGGVYRDDEFERGA